jgi:hypothetical protein
MAPELVLASIWNPVAPGRLLAQLNVALPSLASTSLTTGAVVGPVPGAVVLDVPSLAD